MKHGVPDGSINIAYLTARYKHGVRIGTL